MMETALAEPHLRHRNSPIAAFRSSFAPGGSLVARAGRALGRQADRVSVAGVARQEARQDAGAGVVISTEADRAIPNGRGGVPRLVAMQDTRAGEADAFDGRLALGGRLIGPDPLEVCVVAVRFVGRRVSHQAQREGGADLDRRGDRLARGFEVAELIDEIPQAAGGLIEIRGWHTLALGARGGHRKSWGGRGRWGRAADAQGVAALGEALHVAKYGLVGVERAVLVVGGRVLIGPG